MFLCCCSNICSETKKLLICLVMSEVWEGVHIIFLELCNVLLKLAVPLLNNFCFCYFRHSGLKTFHPKLPVSACLIITCHIVPPHYTVQPFNSVFVCSIFSSEYNAFWRCVQAGATYLFVQLCKVSEFSGD